MNIFYLHSDPVICAQMHCDKHVVKMVLETAQLLSTTRRIMNGKEQTVLSPEGRKKKQWVMRDESEEETLYAASHVNHPCAVWLREHEGHYRWTYALFLALCDEYTFRYGKVHKTDNKLRSVLRASPTGYMNEPQSLPPLAMPDECKSDCAVESYRRYYTDYKKDIAKWGKNRSAPDWWEEAESV